MPFSNEDGVLSSPVEVLGVLKGQDGVLSSPVEVLRVPVPFSNEDDVHADMVY